MASRFPACAAREWALTLAAATLLIATPGLAAYEEAHVTGDEARITVDGAGSARVEHTVAWHLLAGQPHTIDLSGVEASARVEPTASLEADDGRIIPAAVSLVEGKGLHLAITEPRALRHGHYRVRLAYTVDLKASGELIRDGASFRLVWKGLVPREGYDAVKVTFALPGALEEPRPIVGEGGMPDDGVMTALKRMPDHDEVEMVRPHVGRGEEVLWAVRVAARAFDAGRHGVPAPLLPLRRLESRGHPPVVYTALILLALGMATLVRWKDRRFDEACRCFGERASGLVPLGPWERSTLAGACFFIGLSLQLADTTALGTMLVALAAVCAALRPPRATPLPRGPGRWLVLRPDEVFGGSSGPDRWRRADRLDAAAVVGGLLALVSTGYVLRSVQPEAAFLLPCDAVALLPLLLTGRRAHLPPDRMRIGRGWLAAAFGQLRKNRELHVSPWVRVPTGGVMGDELRLLAVPRAPVPGVVGVELGLSFTRSFTSFVRTPEVLVRVHDASPASGRMTSMAATLTPVPGRTPDERVYRFVPTWPTRTSAIELVESLAQQLRDRRVQAIEWAADERRSTSADPVPAT
jgi:hypothetical protein